MKLWFDTERAELVTESQLREDYQAWLPEMVKENGIEYVVENASDFTFDAYANDWAVGTHGGTLIPVYNAEHFTEVKPNASDD